MYIKRLNGRKNQPYLLSYFHQAQSLWNYSNVWGWIQSCMGRQSPQGTIFLPPSLRCLTYCATAFDSCCCYSKEWAGKSPETLHCIVFHLDWKQRKLKKSNVISLKAYKGLAEIAVKCLCELLVALPHFNFHNNIIVLVVPLMDDTSKQVGAPYWMWFTTMIFFPRSHLN